MTADYSNAITAGVFKWLDSNRDEVLKMAQEALNTETKLVMDRAVDLSAAAIMTKVGKWLDDNKDELTTAIAGAIALSWQNRHYPKAGDVYESPDT
jgi:hypothetical protein